MTHCLSRWIIGFAESHISASDSIQLHGTSCMHCISRSNYQTYDLMISPLSRIGSALTTRCHYLYHLSYCVIFMLLAVTWLAVDNRFRMASEIDLVPDLLVRGRKSSIVPQRRQISSVFMRPPSPISERRNKSYTSYYTIMDELSETKSRIFKVIACCWFYYIALHETHFTK